MVRPWNPGPHAPRAHRWLTGVALMLIFATVYDALGYVKFYHWSIDAGFLFVALWVCKRGQWPWLFACTILERVFGGIPVWVSQGATFMGLYSDWRALVLGALAEPFLCVLGVLCLKSWRLTPHSPVDEIAMVRLHLAAGASALAIMAKDVLYVLNDGFVADVTRFVVHDPVPLSGAGAWEVLLRFAIKNFMGYFIGIMLLAPMVWWRNGRHAYPTSRRVWGHATQLTLPASVMFVLLSRMVESPQLLELMRLLLLAIIAVAAMRDGWRGAALALVAVSVAVAIADHLDMAGGSPVPLQMFIAIAGAIGLMCGAAVDELRRQRSELHHSNGQAVRLAAELNRAVIGSQRAEENERRRIASDLHDDLGQNLTALRLFLHASEPRLAGDGNADLHRQLMQFTASMRQCLVAAIERLRPAALDELGLFWAIDRGALRRFAENAGLKLRAEIKGDARLLALLESAYKVTAYRLVQEAVHNCIKHAHATICSVQLRLEMRDAALWLFIDVRDNGVGGVVPTVRGNGLNIMRDRLTAMGGRLYLRNLNPGMRVHALLRQKQG